MRYALIEAGLAYALCLDRGRLSLCVMRELDGLYRALIER
jgi:hypothetical protein